MLAWSRWRFVRFAEHQDQATTLALLADCFELLGGVPGIALTDRMGCLKGGTVANVVVPAPAYVAFAAGYGFRPDFCEAGDPESKGVVENLVGYAKSDLLVGLGPWATIEDANVAAIGWCAEVNARRHSEIAAVPEDRLVVERTLLAPLPSSRPTIGAVETRTVDRLRTVRFRAARYSVPGAFIGAKVSLIVEGPELVIRDRGTEIARHRLVAPGELSLVDAHDGRPVSKPARALRPRTDAELAFLSLGPVAEAFLRAAAAAGTTKLPTELGIIVELERSHGREALVAALERALAFRRFRAADIRAILAAGAGVSRPRAAGAPLTGLPSPGPAARRLCPRGSLVSPRQAAVLEPDLEAGLKRLKLAAVRRMAPEVLRTAKVQRWPPDELLRTLVEAEIAARDASNESTRRKAAGFPVTRRLDDFVLSESSVPRATFDHLASLDWIDAAENVVLVGPAGTGKSHCETEGPTRVGPGSRLEPAAASMTRKSHWPLGESGGHDPKSHWPPYEPGVLLRKICLPARCRRRPGTPRRWPDQKPVHPARGVTHHSPASPDVMTQPDADHGHHPSQEGNHDHARRPGRRRHRGRHPQAHPYRRGRDPDRRPRRPPDRAHRRLRGASACSPSPAIGPRPPGLGHRGHRQLRRGAHDVPARAGRVGRRDRPPPTTGPQERRQVR